MTNPVELKVKSKALEAEAKIIRKEEQKARQCSRWHRDTQDFEGEHKWKSELENLAGHRKGIVRQVAHDTYVARAFLAGRPYSDHQVMRTDRGYTSWYSVRNMVRKYGGPEFSTMTNNEIDEKLINWKVVTSR